VGGTVGSGIFVLTGLIARECVGPGVIFSWMLAGIACSASALLFAEVSCLTPSAGSSYVYVYLGLCELPAFITAWCLTMEYGQSGAAVSGSWGRKVFSLVSSWIALDSTSSTAYIFKNFNIIGGVLQFFVMLLSLRGTSNSKVFVNFFTVLKLILILS